MYSNVPEQYTGMMCVFIQRTQNAKERSWGFRFRDRVLIAGILPWVSLGRNSFCAIEVTFNRYSILGCLSILSSGYLWADVTE
jgi:hypothetical protein